MSYYKLPVIIVLLIVAGGVAGRLAGPALSRFDQRVALARRVAYEEAELEAGRDIVMTLDTEAWRREGETPAQLYARAREVEDRFTVGGTVLGLFIGLVAAMKVVGLRMVPRSDIYSIHHGRCVACTRCYRACPREHERLKALGKEPAD